MSRHKVEISGVNTANIKVLTNLEMRELFAKMQNGDSLARDDLVNGNLKLVLSILKRFGNTKENMNDLFQVGCIGLIKAIDNFDLSHEVKFSTYAVPMILGEIRRYLRDNTSIRISRSVKDLSYQIIKLKDDIIKEEGKEPSYEKIADILGVSRFDIVNAMDAMLDPVSMFEPIYNDGGDTIYLYDQIADIGASNVDREAQMSIKNAILELSTREQLILNQRYVMGKTQMEIAEELTISQAQVSRLEKNAINTLKKRLQ